MLLEASFVLDDNGSVISKLNDLVVARGVEAGVTTRLGTRSHKPKIDDE